MADEKKAKTTNTIGETFYGTGSGGDRALSIKFFESSLVMGLHNALPASNQTKTSKYNYKEGTQLFLRAKTVKKILKAIKLVNNGEEKNVSVTCGSNTDNLVKICMGDELNLPNVLTIAIYPDIKTDKTCSKVDIFQFKTDKLILDYDASTGAHSVVDTYVDFEYFVDILTEFVKSSTNTTPHFVKKEYSFTLERVITRQLEIMKALNIQTETSYSSKSSWGSSSDKNEGSNTMAPSGGFTELDELTELDNL